MPTAAICDALRSETMRDTLEKLNEHFLNRKQEGQIRDAIVVHVNNAGRFRALSEYPKGISSKRMDTGCVRAAADLSIHPASGFGPIFCETHQKPIFPIVEMKQHYPRDLDIAVDRGRIIDDMSREIDGSPTTHFILMVVERSVDEDHPWKGTIKYLERNKTMSVDDLRKLEAEMAARSIVFKRRDLDPVRVGTRLSSIYHFYVYELMPQRAADVDW